MKFLAAFMLVTFSMVSAQYHPRGWKPAGPSFNLPSKSQKQVEQPPVPAGSYGPPPETSYGPPEETTEAISTTTEAFEEITTLQPQAENIKDTNIKPAKLQQPGSYYVVVPQQQKYLVTPQSAPLVAISRARLIASPPQAALSKVPVQAIPAFAKLQELPEVVEAVPVIQAVPVASSAYTSSVYTPYSSSFVQVVQ